MLAGKKMLDEDTSVAANRKHLIFVSDGITYMFNEDPTAVAWNGIVDNKHLGDDAIWANWASPDAWKLMYDDQKYVPENWAEWLGAVKAKLDVQGDTYDYPYKGEIVNETPKKAAEYKNYAMSTDKALYNTYMTYQSCVEAGYNCYAMVAKTGGAAEANPWGPSFMNYLANGKDVTFEDIKNDIYYLVDAGSKVVDVIGYGKDNKGNDYNFDFVPDATKMALTVGGKTFEAIAVDPSIDPEFTQENVEFETARFVFGELVNGNYPYIVHYYANGTDGKSDECFVWDINVPVSNFEPVQLSYTVKLTNPQSAAGSYGEYDRDGSLKLDALYTNVSATLYPVDSNGDAITPELFEKPTVSYKVAEIVRPVPPQTGDTTGMTQWTILATITVAGAIALISAKKRVDSHN